MIRIAFITGATAGIGESCVIKFAENNYNLIPADQANATLLNKQLQ